MCLFTFYQSVVQIYTSLMQCSLSSLCVCVCIRVCVRVCSTPHYVFTHGLILRYPYSEASPIGLFKYRTPGQFNAAVNLLLADYKQNTT